MAVTENIMMASKFFYKKELPHYPAIPLLGIHLKKKKKLILKYCPIVHNTIAYHCHDMKATWVSINWWMYKEVGYIYIYIMEYHSAIRKNEILPLAETYMDLESIILREINQTEKDKYWWYLLNVELKKYNEFADITKRSRITDTENKHGYCDGGRHVI